MFDIWLCMRCGTSLHQEVGPFGVFVNMSKALYLGTAVTELGNPSQAHTRPFVHNGAFPRKRIGPTGRTIGRTEKTGWIIRKRQQLEVVVGLSS